MSERRVFESLCMNPGGGGFSYDTELLVDVDRAFDFDEAVIRLTTKCNSIITQLRTLGHPVTEFSIASAKVGFANRTSCSKYIRSSVMEDTCYNSCSSSPEGRSLRAMEELWCGLKRNKYSGMVAVAQLTRSSIPKNGCASRYSVQALKKALLSHIHAYFMFQAYNPKFQPWSNSCRDEDDDPHAEYLVFLVYRIEAIPTPTGNRSRRFSELERLDASWHCKPSTPKRKRQLSSGSSVSSSSSSSSNPSGRMPLSTPSTHTNVRAAITPSSPFYPNRVYRETEGYSLDWRDWPAPEKKRLSSSRVEMPVLVAGSPMVLRHRKDSTGPKHQRSGRSMTRTSSKLSP